jgi:hypothetical protein
MSHVYEKEPDTRQSNDVNLKVSRFRPTYRALTDDEKKLHDEIKNKAEELETLFNKLHRPSRYHSLALTSLEESVMWAIKELTS